MFKMKSPNYDLILYTEGVKHKINAFFLKMCACDVCLGIVKLFNNLQWNVANIIYEPTYLSLEACVRGLMTAWTYS